MTQNTSHAVMAQRTEPRTSADDFPTPPWATRALMEHVIKPYTPRHPSKLMCLEPACGAGHMAHTLKEYFKGVYAFDKYNYGYGGVKDFLNSNIFQNNYDWIITNPPFILAEEFVIKSLDITKQGVAILARSVFLEGKNRYCNLFSYRPPTIFAQFVERVPMVQGRLDQNASTATSYAWFVWYKKEINTRLIWIPPCRKKLERDGDY